MISVGSYYWTFAYRLFCGQAKVFNKTKGANQKGRAVASRYLECIEEKCMWKYAFKQCVLKSYNHSCI